MTAYLMLWDRDPNSWSNAKRDHKRSLAGRPIEVNWSCGSRKEIPVGSRIFLKRTGLEVRGILASGFTTGPVREGGHWRERGKTARFVPIAFDVVLDPFGDELLAQAALFGRSLSRVHWDTQGGGMKIHDAAESELEELWRGHLLKLQRRSLGTTLVPELPPLQQRAKVWSRRWARDSAFARMVRMKAEGVCAACRAAVSWRNEQLREAAHIMPVEAQGPDHLSNALSLCPNHHALFDGGFWSADSNGRIEFSARLSRAHRKTFARVLRLTWGIGGEFLKFHHSNIFKE